MAIENVSDTAGWVAVYQAIESARPDAIFGDPYAERLAGRRVQEIVVEMAHLVEHRCAHNHRPGQRAPAGELTGRQPPELAKAQV